jgi:hypothetical protein
MPTFRLLSLTTLSALLSLNCICTVVAEPVSRYQGTGSCSSSNCHGSVNPLKGSRVLQNEYYTWLKHDPHSKAFTVLTQPDARKMAHNLGLGDPTKEPTCLTCHSTYVPDTAKHGDRYTLEDGVSCESCHGPAEGWLASHTAADATHQKNLQNGLTDTVNLEKRAKLCLSCHQGDDTKRVTHEIYGAGHPRLRFELDTYGILQPKHWIVDDDYRARKEDYVPVKAWLVGQVAQAQGLTALLRNPHTKESGILPELSVFDCYSCHHSLSTSQWKERAYGGEPGRLHLNVTPLILVEAALRENHAGLAQEITQLIAELNSRYLKDGASTTVSRLSELLSNKALPAARSITADTKSCAALMQALARLGSTQQPLKFELAEQIGMGIQAAAATSPELSQKYAGTLRTLFATIKNADTFSEGAFIEALKPWK